MSEAIGRLHAGRNRADLAQRFDAFPPVVRRVLARADVSVDQLVGLWMWLAGMGGLVGVAAAVHGLVAAIVVLVALVLVPAAMLFQWRDRLDQRVVAGLPDVVDLVGRAMRGGSSLWLALTEASRRAPPRCCGRPATRD